MDQRKMQCYILYTRISIHFLCDLIHFVYDHKRNNVLLDIACFQLEELKMENAVKLTLLV